MLLNRLPILDGVKTSQNGEDEKDANKVGDEDGCITGCCAE
jgi:hypothetical protein